MPKIPVRGRANPNLNVSRAQLENPAFAGQGARAVQNLGRQIQKTTDTIIDTNVRIAKTDASTKLHEIRNGEGGLVTAYDKFEQENSLGDINKYSERAEEWIDTRRSEELEKAGSNRFLREGIEKEFNTFKTLKLEKARTFQQSETLKQGRKRLDDMNGRLVKEILATGDSNLLNLKIREAKAKVSENIGTLYSPQEAEMVNKKLESKFVKAFVKGATSKGNFVEARNIIKQNPEELFGTDISKEELIDQVDQAEEKALDRAYRREQLEERKEKKRNKKMEESILRSMQTLDLTNPDDIEFYEQNIEKMYDNQIINTRKKDTYLNALNREVNGAFEDEILDLFINGKTEEAQVLLARGKDEMDPKAYKTLFKTVNPGSAGRSKKMSDADRLTRNALFRDVKDKYYSRDALNTFEEYTQKNNIQDAVLMTRLKYDLINNRPSNRWTKMTTGLEEKPDYSFDGIQVFKKTKSAELLEALAGGDKKSIRMIKREVEFLKREQTKLRDFERAKELLNTYQTSQNLKDKQK